MGAAMTGQFFGGRPRRLRTGTDEGVPVFEALNLVLG
jgi:hypothetical protein